MVFLMLLVMFRRGRAVHPIFFPSLGSRFSDCTAAEGLGGSRSAAAGVTSSATTVLGAVIGPSALARLFRGATEGFVCGTRKNIYVSDCMNILLWSLRIDTS